MNTINGYTVKTGYRNYDFDNADDAMGFAQAAAMAIRDDDPIEIIVNYEKEERDA